MRALVKERRYTVDADDCEFCSPQPWMRMSFGAIKETSERLYHYIANSVESKWSMPELKIVGRNMDDVEEFEDALQVAWSYRRSRVRFSDGTWIVEYFVCEEGNSDRVFVKGSLILKPV